MTNAKILSLWAPWSHAIACVNDDGDPLKSVETRGWGLTDKDMEQLPIPVLIHATKKWGRDMNGEWLRLCRRSAEILGPDDPRVRLYASVRKPPVRGAIVAACRLADCRPMSMDPFSPWLDPWVDALSRSERLFGLYEAGRFGLILADVRPLVDPIPFSGRQGKLLDAPPELVAEVEAQLGGES